MTSNQLTAKVLGTVHSDVKLHGRDYTNFKFGVVPELCAGIRTISRMDTISNGYHPEWTQSRMDTIANEHNPEWALT